MRDRRHKQIQESQIKNKENNKNTKITNKIIKINKGKIIHHEDSYVIEQVGQRDSAVSVPGGFQDPTGWNPEKPHSWSCLELWKRPPEVPPHLNYPMVLLSARMALPGTNSSPNHTKHPCVWNAWKGVCAENRILWHLDLVKTIFMTRTNIIMSERENSTHFLDLMDIL